VIAWLKRWGWVVLVIAGGVLLYVLTLGRSKPPITREIEAAKAEAKAAKLEARVGRDEAVRQIEEEYQETLAELESRQKDEATKLRKDPKQLSKWLARVASTKGSPG